MILKNIRLSEMCKRLINDCELKYDIESLSKLLRNKYKFLIENVFCRNIDDFKENNVHYITRYDYPVIYSLFKVIVMSNDDEIINKWFNNRITKKEDAIKLYQRVEKIVNELYSVKKIDKVTKDEWLDIVSSSVNYEASKLIMEIEENLLRFERNVFALNTNFKLDNVSFIDDEGNRNYLLEYGYRTLFNYMGDLETESLEELLGAATFQEDYLFLIKRIIDMIQDAAENRAIERIKELAYLKKANNLDKVTDVFGPDDRISLASRQRVWLKKIHDYLTNNPDICENIEKETQTDKLADFFNVHI